jgi:hypothetical protein
MEIYLKALIQKVQVAIKELLWERLPAAKPDDLPPPGFHN